jgi:hypothetical protein
MVYGDLYVNSTGGGPVPPDPITPPNGGGGDPITPPNGGGGTTPPGLTCDKSLLNLRDAGAIKVVPLWGTYNTKSFYNADNVYATQPTVPSPVLGYESNPISRCWGPEGTELPVHAARVEIDTTKISALSCYSSFIITDQYGNSTQFAGINFNGTIAINVYAPINESAEGLNGVLYAEPTISFYRSRLIGGSVTETYRIPMGRKSVGYNGFAVCIRGGQQRVSFTKAGDIPGAILPVGYRYNFNAPPGQGGPSSDWETTGLAIITRQIDVGALELDNGSLINTIKNTAFDSFNYQINSSISSDIKTAYGIWNYYNSNKMWKNMYDVSGTDNTYYGDQNNSEAVNGTPVMIFNSTAGTNTLNDYSKFEPINYDVAKVFIVVVKHKASVPNGGNIFKYGNLSLRQGGPGSTYQGYVKAFYTVSNYGGTPAIYDAPLSKNVAPGLGQTSGGSDAFAGSTTPRIYIIDANSVYLKSSQGLSFGTFDGSIAEFIEINYWLENTTFNASATAIGNLFLTPLVNYLKEKHHIT